MTNGPQVIIVDCASTRLSRTMTSMSLIRVLYLSHSDAILPRRDPITRAMARRLQEDWTKDAREDPRVLMSLRVDFGPMG